MDKLDQTRNVPGIRVQPRRLPDNAPPVSQPGADQYTQGEPSAESLGLYKPMAGYRGEKGAVVVVGGEFTAESHGGAVVRTLRSTGFPGNVYTVHNIPKNPQQAQGPDLNAADLTPEQARKAVETSSWQRVTYALDGYTSALDQASDKGLKDSVVNISSGVSKADVMVGLLGKGMQDPAVLNNFVKAYDLDTQKLDSPDLAIASAERNKLQRGLLGSINAGLDNNPQVAAAQARYSDSVSRVESGHNSVVVSAGNTGDVPAALARRGKIDLPADFQTSYNINSQVTGVGESRDHVAASSSSPEANVKFYTTGQSAGPDQQTGTSFAAPRVSALMAMVHSQGDLTSDQVEGIVSQRYTITMPDNKGQELNLNKAFGRE